MKTLSYHCKRSISVTEGEAYTKGKTYIVEYFEYVNVTVYLKANNGAPNCLFSFEKRAHFLYLYDYFMTTEEAREMKINDLL